MRVGVKKALVEMRIIIGDSAGYGVGVAAVPEDAIVSAFNLVYEAVAYIDLEGLILLMLRYSM